jgi:hypothetical protein
MEPTVRRFVVQVLHDYIKQVKKRDVWVTFGTWQPDEREKAEEQCRRLTGQGYLARVVAQDEWHWSA